MTWSRCWVTTFVSDSAALLGRALVGVAAAVPKAARGLADLTERFGEAEAAKIVASTGIQSRRIADADTCTSDLCHRAAERLLEQLDWDPASVDVLIFVSQTPDYVLPATSCVLHRRLGLSKGCAAFDINLGCSGYVYGLWVAANLLNQHQKRALLLVGDTITKLAGSHDRSVVPIFGDAGTASAIEWTGGTDAWWFEMGTDGSGAEHLKVPAGGFRNRWTNDNSDGPATHGAAVRSDADLYMNGPEVFAFTLKEVIPLITRTAKAASWSMADVDAFVLHQANRFMLEHLAKKGGIPKDKLPIALGEFGNTSSASIPLALVHSLGDRLADQSMRLVLSGFGVGFSWGAVAMTAGPVTVVPVLEV